LRLINIGLAIRGGQLSASTGKFVFRPINLAGRVSGGSYAKLNGIAGPRQAVGTGQFYRSKGNGKWDRTGPSGVCSGYWITVRG